jgi:hypothetical protein
LIKTYVERPYSHIPFLVQDNELYLIEKVKKAAPKRFKAYKKRWNKLEQTILCRTPWGKTEIRDLWVGVLIKGTQLFLDLRANYGPSFHSIIQKIDESQETLLPEEIKVLDGIQKFKLRVFKPEVMKHSRLKSLLHIVAYFREGSKPAFKEEVKEYFLDQAPELIKKLPKHKQPEPPSTMMRHHFPPSFDPILDDLIDRHVFAKFEFLSL